MNFVKMIANLTFVTVIVILFIAIANGECNRTYDTSKCGFDIYCEGVFDDFSDRNYYCIPTYDGRNEDDCEVIRSNNDGDCYPIYLKLHSSHLQNDYYPVTSNDYILRLVISLDLSDSNFYDFPGLKTTLSENLKYLIMSNNYIRIAEFSKLQDLRRIESVDLSHNAIEEITQPNRNLDTIKELDLSYNQLKVITNMFGMFKNLKHLDLSFNNIDYLSPFTFDGLTKVNVLNLGNNLITDINASLYRFAELRSLKINNNKIKNLKANDFEMNINLIDLDASFNRIEILGENLFEHNTQLRNLNLSYNTLTNVSKVILAHTNLQIFDISYNYIKKLEKGLFNKRNITYFSIARNHLQGKIETGVFSDLKFNQELDLSHQSIEGIEDYAFNGLLELKTLMLQHNQIEQLSPLCFMTLKKTTFLDLSFNKLSAINFKTDDLHSLVTLSLKHNHIVAVTRAHFDGLTTLQSLDLSNNKISQIETGSFLSLKYLTNLDISNNNVSGVLNSSTFEGLRSLPSLDISQSLITLVQNNSFTGMSQLKYLNLSRGRIDTLEFNAFKSSDSIETLDLSYNNINIFNVNTTLLVSLESLYLNDNKIRILESNLFRSMTRLSKLLISHNEIDVMDPYVFSDQNLEILDVSFNNKLNFNISVVSKMSKLRHLKISGIKIILPFINTNLTSLTKLKMSNVSLTNVQNNNLNSLVHLKDLTLSNNEITKLEIGCLNNLTDLLALDFSYNTISFIQPNTFKDNVLLLSLNLSHNSLTAITYGMFRGLNQLNILDISYNSIKVIQNEMFYQIGMLNTLILDHNKIESVKAEDFEGTKISVISIGGNPMPCDMLIKLKRLLVEESVTITAISIEHNEESVDGITCNKGFRYNGNVSKGNVSGVTSGNTDNLLLNIRDILIDKLEKTTSKDSFADTTSQLEKSIQINNEKLTTLANSTAQILGKNDKTNSLLEKILKVLTIKYNTPIVPTLVNNATNDNILDYVNKIKQHVEETLAIERNNDNNIENKINELEIKIASLSHQNDSLIEEVRKHEELKAESLDTKLTLVETCVIMLLCLLVALVLYKIYKSRIFFRKQLSISTRELPSAMDSTL